MKTLAPRLAGLLTLLWLALMLVLTLTPAKEMPRTPAWKLLSFDTAAHAGVFAVLAGLAWLWARQRPRLRRPASLVLVGCIALGALIEVLQYAMRLGRHAEWTDLLSDTIGAALGLALVMGLAQRGRPRPALALALLLLPLGVRAQAPAPGEPDLARARRTIAALASERMHGRGYVRQGEHVAAAYLRGRLRRLGLQPLAPDYTQPFTLDVNTFPGILSLTLVKGYPNVTGIGAFGGDELRLKPGRDFIMAPASGGGQLIQAPRFANAKPKITFPPFPTNELIWPSLVYLDSLTINTPSELAGFMRASRQPCAVVLRDRVAQAREQLTRSLQQRLDSVPATLAIVPKLTASLAANQISQMQLQVLPHPLLQPAPQAAHTLELVAEAKLRRNYPTQNLAAIVRGRAQPDSFLVVSAHYDHLGTMGEGTYFPGANDNASGVALLLELAAHYAQPENRPACSVVFLLFGAEEAGLLGSSYFVQHPLVPLANIKFLLNLDLLGTGEEGATVVNGRVHEAAFTRLTALNEAHHYLPRLTARGRAANSDHYPFSQAGVPAFFLYTRGGSPAYHDVNDRPAALSLAGFAGAFRLSRDFLASLGAR